MLLVSGVVGEESAGLHRLRDVLSPGYGGTFEIC